jgi:hypothetical protein
VAISLAGHSFFRDSTGTGHDDFEPAASENNHCSQAINPLDNSRRLSKTAVSALKEKVFGGPSEEIRSPACQSIPAHHLTTSRRNYLQQPKSFSVPVR